MNTKEKNEIRRKAKVLEEIHWKVRYIADEYMGTLDPAAAKEVKDMLEGFSQVAWDKTLDALEEIDELKTNDIA